MAVSILGHFKRYKVSLTCQTLQFHPRTICVSHLHKICIDSSKCPLIAKVGLGSLHTQKLSSHAQADALILQKVVQFANLHIRSSSTPSIYVYMYMYAEIPLAVRLLCQKIC